MDKRFWILLFVLAVFGIVMAVGSDSLYAAAETVTITPLVDFSTVITSITSMLGPVIAGAVGLGLAIWGVYFIASTIKRMAR